jgi:hypothetical protein
MTARRALHGNPNWFTAHRPPAMRAGNRGTADVVAAIQAFYERHISPELLIFSFPESRFVNLQQPLLRRVRLKRSARKAWVKMSQNCNEAKQKCDL